ncbi:MAG: tyrosine--tRNA ligase [Actinobacteria bacterium]|uniref:tyrosine--tRNA ligase n=1 Tax=freshwater metagenome TaxID=449393 RepID=A0A6J5ZL11_9ZZZZ|nr:tyrosine--tRNA ligase [Actinomycetota bacterium]
MKSAASNSAHLTRNAAEEMPAGELKRKLLLAESENRALRVKLGLDPTAPDIHLGHTVVLQKLREFQDAGHKVVLIVGDQTARVGDPSGRSETRPVLTGAEILANAQTYEAQAALILDQDPARYELRFNSEWLDMSMDDLLGLVRTTTVAQLLEREDFANRYKSGEPISILELLYPLMQGYDSVAVQSDVELGGTDQTFNILLGRDIQRHYGVPEQAVLTMPILPGIDGVDKMSKTKGNEIAITAAPDEMFGRTMRLPDEAMESWFHLLAVAAPPQGTAPREAKASLAKALVERFHGEEAASAAEAQFNSQFVAHEVPDDVELFSIAADGEQVHLPSVLAEAFGISRSEARRLLEQGGVKVDGAQIAPEALDISCEALEGAIVQIGRRRFKKFKIVR